MGGGVCVKVHASPLMRQYSTAVHVAAAMCGPPDAAPVGIPG